MATDSTEGVSHKPSIKGVLGGLLGGQKKDSTAVQKDSVATMQDSASTEDAAKEAAKNILGGLLRASFSEEKEGYYKAELKIIAPSLIRGRCHQPKAGDGRVGFTCLKRGVL